MLSALLDSSSRRSARTPSPLQAERTLSTQRSRSPLSPSRPRSAAALLLEAVATLTPQYMTQQPRSPQSGFGWSDESSTRTLSSRPTTAQSSSRPDSSSLAGPHCPSSSTSRLGASNRFDRSGSSQRSRSPVPAGRQIDAASMIPDSAMRPAKCCHQSARGQTSTLPLCHSCSTWSSCSPRLVRASGSSSQVGCVLAVTETTSKWAARDANEAYEQFVATTQPKPLREVVSAAEEKVAAQTTSSWFTGHWLPREEQWCRYQHLPLQRTGTLSEWLEQQMRASAEIGRD